MNQAQKKVEQHLNYMIKQWEIKGSFDILNYITEHVTLFQLVDTVGDVNHAVIISGNWIFDSNYNKSLPLAILSLDLICSSLDGDEMFAKSETVFYAVRYVNAKDKLKLVE